MAIAILAHAGVLAGCSSVTSQVEDASKPAGDGIAYYLPKRPIQVTVTLDDKGKQTAAVENVDSVPDLSRRFVLYYEENFVGTNHLKVDVTQSGLLTTSNADTKSGITDIVKNIGKSLGTVAALAAAAAPGAPPPSAQPCQSGRTYTFLLWPEQKNSGPACDFQVTVKTLTGEDIQSQNVADTKRVLDVGSSQSGIFYKQNIPYLVQLTDSSGNTSSYIAYSPDLSPILFVPVTRTLFSDNKTDITLEQGTLKSVDESSDGEVVALSELPADFITAYLTALGSVLTQIGTNVQDQTTIINNRDALAVAKVKQQACASAIAANKASLDPDNFKDKKDEALANAIANMKTAMSNINSVCS